MWSWSADELLRRAGSDDPTPGSGAIAAAAGALGVVLVRKAIAVTGEPAVARDERTAALEGRARSAADADVVAFGALIDARGMPQDGAGQRAARDAAVEAALRGHRGALRAVDLDLDELERTGSADAQRLRERRDEVVAALEAATEP